VFLSVRAQKRTQSGTGYLKQHSVCVFCLFTESHFTVLSHLNGLIAQWFNERYCDHVAY